VNWIAAWQWSWGAQVLVCFYYRAWTEMAMGLAIVAIITVIRVRNEKERKENEDKDKSDRSDG
jgi:hypothetical protein